MRTSAKYLLLTAACVLAVLLLLPELAKWKASPALPGIDGEVDFNFHVKPILADRCFKCHGPDKNQRKEDLRLDTEEGLYKALKSDPKRKVIVPGKPELSELYLRISSKDTSIQMPPPESHLSLTQAEIEMLKQWISEGAKYKKHWAFIPPEKPPLPKIRQQKLARNEIDYFILQKIQAAGLSPNEEADKERLLRRLSFDLTGLPPSVAMMDRFLTDDSPEAYAKMVDSLLARPAFGEHMASSWLDLARYADSHGYQDDSYRSIWPWRDWVIHAFNENLPYDEFVTEQLAGDLLPNATKDQILATGFCRNHKITQEGGVIDEEYRLEYATDKTNTYSKALLGLTMECAKCHDHKYDPVSQAEYYQTFAFFNRSKEKGYYGDVGFKSIAEPPVLVPTKEELSGVLRFINQLSKDSIVTMVMADDSIPRPTFVLKRGQYDQPGDSVPFGTPKAILDFPEDFPKNRLGLARWTFHPDNPLTARVAVNRIWQELFGVGLVKTSDNFGIQGEIPSHPQLLDWLAVDFLENGWNVKRLLKLIVTSATYRQSAAISAEQLAKDPENRLLSRAPRFRMMPEMIRDTWLAASDLLNPEIGGPSVRPYQPPGLWEDMNAGDGRGSLTKYKQDDGEKLYRRSLYTIWKRTLPHPMMTTFDAPIRDNCAIKRQRTNTPLQALNLMNDPQMLEASRALAEQMQKDQASGLEQKLTTAFRRILSRQPVSAEVKLMLAHFEKRKTELAARGDAVKTMLLAGASKPDPKVNPLECAALMETVQLIFNMDEAIGK